MFILHRKHITSLILSQPVNAMCRFVTLVYQYNSHNSGRYHRPVLYVKHYVSETGFCSSLQVGPTEYFTYEDGDWNSLRNAML
jgi:hypothetical protein